MSQGTSLSARASGAETYTVSYGETVIGIVYYLSGRSGQHLSVDTNGVLAISSKPKGWKLFAVTHGS